MNILYNLGLLMLGAGLGVVALAVTSINARNDERDEMARLRGFAQDILKDWPDVGYIDGFDLQQLAHKHGLLVSETLFKPCGEQCSCAEMVDQVEWDEGVTCYRKTPLLKGGAA